MLSSCSRSHSLTYCNKTIAYWYVNILCCKALGSLDRPVDYDICNAPPCQTNESAYYSNTIFLLEYTR
ncbi:hypothetical protein COCCADRAFT_102173 [Bipolaris zeicola 26-R-13]|uniref:Uncharacterized protein n=1 Tax=Cochliobolus carbonum (strain 26-R-13) TaxID=930089 RepID=W6XZD0_COCC2|nr:uncharacterized protein COCCADRAFT_102173 [Bipolaris zeicola 26-R-13]EUC31108.1 hypothetical protein COCCADRAFT_102173 [Bipolaris zeicola 26-R-13]